MPGKSFVTLDPSFGEELDKFAATLDEWSEDVEARLLKAHKRIGHRHAAEAKKRVPRRTGRLANSITSNAYKTAEGITTETGTNVPEYPVYLEFGTRHIAGGKVLAIGTKPNVKDTEAVHSWPAKDREAIGATSRGPSSGAGRAQEMMPFLRTAWSSIRDWALRQLKDAMKPPGK